MVQHFHQNGIGVIMDVVFNHTHNIEGSCFQKTVPDYFYRKDGEQYSDASACGNEIASDRAMVRKYIVDSVCYWADEYHMDGFRFDLVGLLDTDTINEIVEEVHKTHTDIIFYGEGWTMETSVTKDNVTMATQVNSASTPDFAFFNDNMRDGLKGSVFDTATFGFVSGAVNSEKKMADSFMANESWSKEPSQIINYASCHDNNTLFDRIAVSKKASSEEDIIKMNNLAAAFYMTAEGVPFLQAGEEMLRTKVNDNGTFNSNSYNAGDEVNSIKWDTLSDKKYADVFEYYKGLIKFRKAHPALRLSTSEDVKKYVKSVEGLEDNIVGINIKGGQKGESAKEMYLLFNANTDKAKVTIPEGKWKVCINGQKAGVETIETIKGGEYTMDGISALVLVKQDGASMTIVIVLIAAAVVVVAGVALVVKKKANK